MSDQVEHAVTIERSLDDTWGLITNPKSLGEWMGGRFEIDLEEGGQLSFHTGDRVQRGTVTEITHRQRLAWTWSDGPDESLVSIEIDGDDRSTTVLVTERLLLPRSWSKPSIPPTEAVAV